jgi:hypothetical protein
MCGELYAFGAPITRAASSSPRPRSRRLRLPRSRAGALDYGARIARALSECENLTALCFKGNGFRVGLFWILF